MPEFKQTMLYVVWKYPKIVWDNMNFYSFVLFLIPLICITILGTVVALIVDFIMALNYAPKVS